VNAFGRLRAVLGLGALGLAGCLPAITASSSTPAVVRVETPPQLRPGDRWVYEWKSGADSGTKTAEVVRVMEVNTVPYYVFRIDETEHFYTLDLRWAASARESKIEFRMLPPQPWFTWPLEVGRRWEHRGTFEAPDRKSQHTDTFAVVATEVVDVPAGRFTALKLVRETDRRDTDTYWFAPDVRWYVKWVGRRGDVEFEEQLREHRLTPRLRSALSPRPAFARSR
jgi:hypothetical protein